MCLVLQQPKVTVDLDCLERNKVICNTARQNSLHEKLDECSKMIYFFLDLTWVPPRLWCFRRDWDAREELQYLAQLDAWSLKTKSLTQKVFCSVQYLQGENPSKSSHAFEGAWFITPPPTPRSSTSCSTPVLWPCPISSLHKNVLAASCDKDMEHLGSAGSHKNLLSPLHPFLCCTSLIKQ